MMSKTCFQVAWSKYYACTHTRIYHPFTETEKANTARVPATPQNVTTEKADADRLLGDRVVERIKHRF